jgi:hypothetical protein
VRSLESRVTAVAAQPAASEPAGRLWVAVVAWTFKARLKPMLPQTPPRAQRSSPRRNPLTLSARSQQRSQLSPPDVLATEASLSRSDGRGDDGGPGCTSPSSTTTAAAAAAAEWLDQCFYRASVDDLIEEVRQSFQRALDAPAEAAAAGGGGGNGSEDRGQEEGACTATAGRAFRACAVVLGQLRQLLADADAGGAAARGGIGAGPASQKMRGGGGAVRFYCTQHRLQLEDILNQLWDVSLHLHKEDELSIAAVVHVFDFMVSARGTAVGPPSVLLHTAVALAPMMDRMLPFCEGYVRQRVPGFDGGDSAGWLRRWLVLDRQRLFFYTSRDAADTPGSACCAQVPVAALELVQTKPATRVLTLRFRRPSTTTEWLVPLHGGAAEAMLGVLELCLDVPVDFTTWADALHAATAAAVDWDGFSQRQPQWLHLMESSGVALRVPSLLQAGHDPEAAAAAAAAAFAEAQVLLATECTAATALRPDATDTNAAGGGRLLVTARRGVAAMAALISDAVWTRCGSLFDDGWTAAADRGNGSAAAAAAAACERAVPAEAIERACERARREVARIVSALQASLGLAAPPSEGTGGGGGGGGESFLRVHWVAVPKALRARRVNRKRRRRRRPPSPLAVDPPPPPRGARLGGGAERGRGAVAAQCARRTGAAAVPRGSCRLCCQMAITCHQRAGLTSTGAPPPVHTGVPGARAPRL